MALDHYITLGRSGLRVSPFALGAMTFGEDLGWGSSVEESQQIIDRYIGLGGNFIDTANFYTKSHSEQIIGDHIGREKARRDRLVLATKFSGNLYPGDPNGGGSSRKAIVGAAENSLRRLQTDYIDLYWLHIWDKNTPIEETMAALDDLVRAGKVRYIGVSDTPAWKVAQANTLAQFRGWSAFAALQIEYSLLERTVEQDLIPMALEFGLGVTPWSPLKSGALSGKYTRANAGQQNSGRGPLVAGALNETTFALIDQLELIAKAHETSVAAVSLAWLCAKPGVTSPIIGARRLDQLEDNIKALDVTLTADDIAALDKITQPKPNFPHNMLPMAPAIINGGASVNGVTLPPSGFVMLKGETPAVISGLPSPALGGRGWPRSGRMSGGDENIEPSNALLQAPTAAIASTPQSLYLSSPQSHPRVFMARVTVEDCVEKVPNRFNLVLLSAHRARAISAGSAILVDRDNDKNPVVALREIADDVVDAEALREGLITSLQRVDERADAEEEAEALALLADPQHQHMSEQELVRALQSDRDGGQEERY